jgi:hypothetical protein
MSELTAPTEDGAGVADAPLGGGLLVLLVMASATALLVALGLAFAPAQLAALGQGYAAAVIFAGLWSLAFVVLTLLRWRGTPMLAAGGLAVWVFGRCVVTIVAGGILQNWPLLVDLSVEAFAAAGLAAYLVTGKRANAYFSGHEGRRASPSSRA